MQERAVAAPVLPELEQGLPLKIHLFAGCQSLAV